VFVGVDDVTRDDDIYVAVYDLLSGEIVSNLRKHRQCVRDVSWHPYDHRLVSSSVRPLALKRAVLPNRLLFFF